MRTDWLAPILGLLMLVISLVFMPGFLSARGESSGCNSICAGPHPGACTYTWQDYFCVDAQPPWLVCMHEEYECVPP
jgi:hypothetical protein